MNKHCWTLHVSDDGHRLEKTDGSPWFWLGDTAWDLFIRPNRDELKTYFQNRREKGFTVILAVAVMGYHVAFNAPNAFGDRPFIDDDPTKPDIRKEENFWTHVDYVIDTAREFGLYIALLPVWGYFVAGIGKGPLRFTRENVPVYAQWIAKRYRGIPNVIWVNGGDIAGNTKEGETLLWDLFGKTIKENDPDHLMTFHPCDSKSSSILFHDCKWLDFNMIQSGHTARAIRSDAMIDTDYNLNPAKPVLDGEPRYEQHPIGWTYLMGCMSDYDVRQAAYWALFAGAFGHTYGHVNVWVFHDPDYVYAEPQTRVVELPQKLRWQEELNSAGAYQMTFVRNLMLSRPATGRVPNQEILSNELLGEARVRAMTGEGYAFVYTALGYPVEIDFSKIPWEDSVAWWYDPRTGSAQFIDPASASFQGRFIPPGIAYRGNDWVLVIDDKRKNYPPPASLQGTKHPDTAGSSSSVQPSI